MVAERPLSVRVNGFRKSLGQCDGERLDRTIEECIKLIAFRFALDDFLVDSEVIVDILLDQFHLIGVNSVSTIRYLFNIAVSVREQKQSAVLSAQVLSSESRTFFGKVFRCREIVHLCDETIRSGILDRFFYALVLDRNEIHRVIQGSV